MGQSEEEALRAQIAKLEQDAREALEERSSLVWQVRYRSYPSFWINSRRGRSIFSREPSCQDRGFSLASRRSSVSRIGW